MKWVREPLVHFLIAGLAVFVAYGLFTGEENDTDDRQIVVTADRVATLRDAFERTWRRAPNPIELSNLVNDFVLEEIYYREALTMGLDQDDTVIRRRLRQKLEFMTEEATFDLEPSDEELQQYLDKNPEPFRTDSVYSFRHVYIDPDRHEQNLDEHIADTLKALGNGEVVRGDSALIDQEFEEISGRVLDRMLGMGFSGKLNELELGVWQGPVRSGLGLHLVLLTRREAGRVPGLDEVRDLVRREWVNERRIASRREFNERLRERYTVVLDVPEALSGTDTEGAR